MKTYPANKVYRIMEPRPIVLVTTLNRNGTFKIDGKTIDLRARMVKWKELID